MEYDKFTPKMALQLAAPHTWAASIAPVMLAVSLALSSGREVSASLALVLLAISVLMQSAVNAMNDYFDFVKGADSAEDNLEADDAVLVYSNVRPRSVALLAVGFLACAFALGTYVIAAAGWIPLAIAAVGALAVFLYSGGSAPISYLPIGELVSGFVMGELITLACFYSLTLEMDWTVLAWALPLLVGIGLVMMTNNACDIEKDERVGRRTLPVLLGRTRTKAAYHGAMVLWQAAIVAIVCIWFPAGAVMLPFLLLAALPLSKALWKNPLVQASRVAAMSQVCCLNVALAGLYCACVLAGGFSVGL